MIQGFSYYLCLLIKGSGSEAGSEAGSVRPQNIRIRIRNTALVDPWLLRFGRVTNLKPFLCVGAEFWDDRVVIHTYGTCVCY
jgi:hypothetical protein